MCLCKERKGFKCVVAAGLGTGEKQGAGLFGGYTLHPLNREKYMFVLCVRISTTLQVAFGLVFLLLLTQLQVSWQKQTMTLSINTKLCSLMIIPAER